MTTPCVTGCARKTAPSRPPLTCRRRGPAEQLRAGPEHLKAQAYDEPQDGHAALTNAVYPPTLPFDLWLETVRVFLAQLGTSRLDVMHTFADDSDEIATRMAFEELGLSRLKANHGAPFRTSPRGFESYYGIDRPEWV